MKNIHLIPTDKPSSLYVIGKEVKLRYVKDLPIDSDIIVNQNIYITNDEEIKRDWFISLNDDESFMEIIKNNEVDDFSEYADEDWVENCKKIILTTDQHLINDGVQSIDDEFLEWFVKNPSCEWVWIKEKQHFESDKSKRKNPLNGVYYSYKIIIPKEEPKPHSFCETPEEKCTMNYCDENGCQNRKRELVEPKQETLEEVAEKIYLSYENNDLLYGHSEELQLAYKAGIVDGAKLQQERMYSEEEVLEIVSNCDGSISQAKKWFEQFKKK